MARWTASDRALRAAVNATGPDSVNWVMPVGVDVVEVKSSPRLVIDTEVEVVLVSVVVPLSDALGKSGDVFFVQTV